ncbi:MAG: PaRep2b protein [Pyrobaculum sp.]
MAVKISYVLRGEKLTVYFNDEKGNELAHINVGWDGKSLCANFHGTKEKAERLASVLSALGAKAEAKRYGKYWYVVLSTDSITAIRRPEWLEAVKALVEALHKRGIINSEKRKYLLRELAADPNVIEIAGAEMGVTARRVGDSKWLVIKYQPKSANAFDAEKE